MWIEIVTTLIAIFILISIYQKHTNAVCTSKRRLDGRTALVTGGTAGMGLEIAKNFAQRGAKVIIACPFKDEGEAARNLIVQETENEKVVFKYLDLASLKTVRALADDILKNEDRLDLLINNAGVAYPDDFLTEDGLNFIMQVNHFGHFLLTMLLLPLLKKSGPSRIVNTSSVSQWMGQIDIVHLNSVGYWFKILIYSNSKFAVIPFARELTKHLKGTGVFINCVDPGAVGTNFFVNLDVGILWYLVKWWFKYMFKSPWEGAQTAIHVAVDDSVAEVSGKFFNNCKQTWVRAGAYDNETAKWLWQESVRLVKLTEEELAEALKPVT